MYCLGLSRMFTLRHCSGDSSELTPHDSKLLGKSSKESQPDLERRECMALELFVQLLETCGINMNFSSLVLIYSYRLPTILFGFSDRHGVKHPS